VTLSPPSSFDPVHNAEGVDASLHEAVKRAERALAPQLARLVEELKDRNPAKALRGRSNSASGAARTRAPNPEAGPTLTEVAAEPGLLNALAVDALVDLRRRLAHMAVEVEAAIALRGAQRIDETSPEASAGPYLTIPEVAKRTGLSVSFLYELARAGELPVRQMGRRRRGYRVLLGDLLGWEAGRRKDAVGIEVRTVPRLRPAVPNTRRSGGGPR
jgi:excisionase family DNA binding protein